MTQERCSIEGCSHKPLARGLCNMHYYRAKRDGNLDQLAPKSFGPCQACGRAIPPTRRYGAKFCSTACKNEGVETARTAARAAVRTAAERLCAWCREPLGAMRMSARFCSTKCSDDWSNHQRSVATRRAVLASRKPCEVCGNPVPSHRRANAIYCSQQCKQRSQRSVSDPARRASHSANIGWKYGITATQFDALLEQQDGRCAICGTTEWPGKGNRPHIDHCHNSSAIRGILCQSCNLGLGNFKDDPTRLRVAAEYLDRHRPREE